MAIVQALINDTTVYRYSSVPFTEAFEIELFFMVGSVSNQQWIYSQWYDSWSSGPTRLGARINSGSLQTYFDCDGTRGTASNSSHPISANTVNKLVIRVEPSQYTVTLNNGTPDIIDASALPNFVDMAVGAQEYNKTHLGAKHEADYLDLNSGAILSLRHSNIVGGNPVEQLYYQFWDKAGTADVPPESGALTSAASVLDDSGGATIDLVYNFDDTTGNLERSGTTYVNQADILPIIGAPSNQAPVVTLSRNTDTIEQGGTYTLPTVTVTDDNDTGLGHTWSGTADVNTIGDYVFTATSDPDSSGLTGAAQYTLSVIAASGVPDIPRGVIPIGGQSNAVSRAGAQAQDLDYTLGTYPVQGRVYQIGVGDTTLREATNPLDHHDEQSGSAGFWKTALQEIAGDKIVLPLAKGGSTFFYQYENNTWSRQASSTSSRGLYYNTARDNINLAMSLNAGNTLDCFIWCQGETDADNNRTYQQYLDNIRSLRANLIEDTAMTINTKWIIIGIKGPQATPEEVAARDVINSALEAFANEMPNGFFISTTDLTMQDAYHYDIASQRTIGDRIAVAYNTDTEKPVITLTAGTDTVTVGGAWTDAGATWTDNVDGSGVIASGVGSVDTNTVGTYSVTYDYTDAAGNAADTVTRTVNVVAAADIEKPVLTLNGQATVSHTQGEAFTDLGANWTDNIDGSGTVYADTALNVNLVGTQTLTYNYTDVAGNVADPVTRTVTVNAVITGDDPVIYGQVDIVGSLRNPVTQTITAHNGDTLKITPTILDNDNQPLTIGSLTINVFGAAQAIGHGASVFATASSANQNNQIEIMASGPNNGQRVAAVITVNVI